MAEIKCMPLKHTTDGPLFGAPPGTLGAGGSHGTFYALQNMMLRPGGYAEARGGMDELKPSGGTAADAITQGGYSAALQMSTSYGWVRSYDDSAGAGSKYSGNIQLHQGGVSPFGPTAALTDAMYWGADTPFSRIGLSLSVAANWSVTLTYEYWNGAAWSALTTAETITWTTLRTMTFASWTLPNDWATTTTGDSGTGNVLKYWMRIRISAFVSVTTTPLAGLMQGFWTGMRELYVATQNPRSAANTGALKRHGQTGTTEEWFSVNAALYSGVASPSRMVEYRGRVIMTNGKETKRWDGANFKDLGIQEFLYLVGNYNLTDQPGGNLAGNLVFRYYGAFAEGPCQSSAGYADRQDALPLYGVGRAAYMTEITTNAAGNRRIRFEITGVSIPAGVSAFYLYRTDDLTNVAVADRGNAPAYLVQSFRIQDYSGNLYEQGLGTAGNYYYDDSLTQAFPLQEALTFDIAPPGRCKYSLIYQNRLLLGDDETWWVSDPFTPDKFSTRSTTGYIRLARAKGGRHMNGVEFADQAVLFTEDQTWGLTNVDLDVPQLFPIHPGVGCVAPDSICVGDGVLMWLARDGFYIWAGGREAPRKVSGDWDITFANMSFENQGGTKAALHNRMYDVRTSNPDYTSTGVIHRLEMDTGTWSVIVHGGPFSSTLFPLAVIHAPLGNNDAGVLHPLWGKVDYTTAAGEYSLFLGELTTQDNANNYTCYASMHFPLAPSEVFSAKRLLCYYQAADGWGTPALSFVPADVIGSAPGTMNTGTPDTGTDYSVVTGTLSSVTRGTSDLRLGFSVASAGGGTVQRQRFFGGVLEGEGKQLRRGA